MIFSQQISAGATIMITYVSLFIGMVSAILGVLFKSRKKVGDQEVFSHWVWLFLAVPVLAFGVSAAKTYKDGVDSKAAKEEAKREADAAERRRLAEAGLAERRRSQELALSEKRRTDELTISDQKLDLAEARRVQDAQAAQARLEIVRSKVDQSINRVSYFQVGLQWGFKSSEIGLPKTAKDFMKSYLAIYTEIQEVDGKYIYGFSSAMFDNWRSAAEDERRFFGEVERSIGKTATAAGGYVFIGKPGSLIYERIGKRLTAGFVSPEIDLKGLPRTVVWYPIVNPRASLPTPPLPTVSAQWDWSIPDRDSPDPLIKVTWIDRVLSDRSSTFIARDDYRDAEVAIYTPRPNPDLDGAPSLGAFGSPLGKPVAATIDIGGRKWSWNENRGADTIALRMGRGAQKKIVGYVIRLRAK